MIGIKGFHCPSCNKDILFKNIKEKSSKRRSDVICPVCKSLLRLPKTSKSVNIIFVVWILFILVPLFYFSGYEDPDTVPINMTIFGIVNIFLFLIWVKKYFVPMENGFAKVVKVVDCR